jgi:hypothetical protein
MPQPFLRSSIVIVRRRGETHLSAIENRYPEAKKSPYAIRIRSLRFRLRYDASAGPLPGKTVVSFSLILSDEFSRHSFFPWKPADSVWRI